MIRYLFSIGFLVCCTGLPLQAKGTMPTPSKPSPKAPAKADTKTAASTTASCSTPAKKQEPATSSTETKTAKTDKHQDKKPAVVTTKGSSSTPSLAKSSPSSNNSRACHSTDTDGGRLARLTAYWAGEGDYYTGRCISSTGVRLHDGHCAVDPRIIPYGSIVKIAGIGSYLAVDTGSAVISREAAKEAGHTAAERSALVIDIFFENRHDGERFAAAATKYAAISWTTPTASNGEAKDARSLFADEDWGRIRNKQL